MLILVYFSVLVQEYFFSFIFKKGYQICEALEYTFTTLM